LLIIQKIKKNNLEFINLLRQFLILVFFLCSTVIYSQSDICAQAEPFCADSTGAYFFENSWDPSNPGPGNGPQAESGPNYSCLGGTPNPTWFFLQIDQDGDLNFDIVQSSNTDFTSGDIDVDFIAYGPFTNTNVCNQLGTAPIVACSFSPAPVENFTITNAQAGEIYILLITNYDNLPGYIQLQQTNIGGGVTAGSTDCSIVNTNNYCAGETIDLDATTPSAVSYEWFQDGTLLTETGPILPNVVAPSAVYTANALGNLAAIISTFEFIINFEIQPMANAVADMLQCDDDNDGFYLFNLEFQTAQILGIQDSNEFTVTYHLSQADADTNTNSITSPYENTSNPQTIYARIENNKLTDCFDTTTFVIQVFDSPTANVVPDQEVCDDNNDGVWSFDLVGLTPLVLDTQNAAQFKVSFHLTQNEANNDLNILTSLYQNTSNLQTIYTRIENNDNTACFDTGFFNLIVYDTPVPAPLVELFQCDDDADGFVNFNLTEANELISANYLTEMVTFYTVLADAQTGVNAIANPIAYTNTNPSAAPDILYVRTENNDGCFDVSQLNLLVSTTNVPQTFQLAYEVCDDTVIDGDDHNGIATFDFSNAEAQIQNSFPFGQALTITYYETLDDALAETNAIPDISNHRNDASPFVQNIYVRIDSDLDNACLGLGHHITLTVNPVPEVIAVTNYIVCEDNTDGFYDFDLESKNSEVLNGQDPGIFAVTYHETQADADANDGALISPYTNITNPQLIYVRITNTITGCSKSVVDFNVEVQEDVQANQNIPIYAICDEFNANDGFAEFDLLSQDALVLDGQDPADYNVSYYLTQNEADLALDELDDIYENITNPQIIYVRVDDITITNSICWATTEIILRVDLLPIFDLDDDYLLCLNTNGTEVVDLPILDTELSNADYTFEWNLNGSVLPAETTSSLMPSVGGTYSVLVVNNITGCENTDTAIVNESSPPTITAAVVSNVFATNHIVDVTAVGLGVYEYSLGNGSWQNSNVFENVSLGIHTVTVRDINGCGIATTSVLVIDYPLFFTPNGDGYHDTWNIVGIATQPDAVIYIFDRFGKLLKQLSPTGNGWNGTYNGVVLPTNDYWFLIEYNEPIDGKRKEFKAHFTLKR
jgi:gliding motility-associated-like protein